MPGPVQLYAELLPNIGQVSVYIWLGSPVTAATKVRVFVDRDSTSTQSTNTPGQILLRVHHAGDEQQMKLPGRVGLRGNLPVSTEVVAAQQEWLRFRLPHDPQHENNVRDGFAPLAELPRHDDDDSLPWSGPALPAASAVTCRVCSTAIVADGQIAAWKDLPSDNWAEMMEFWHCHKPETAENSSAHPTRGYGANATLAAEPRIGFVDLNALLFAESDCRNLLYSASTPDKASANRESVLEREPSRADTTPARQDNGDATDEKAKRPKGKHMNIFCSHCRALVGYWNSQMLAASLFKWAVSVPKAREREPLLAECISTTLVATIARTGASKSVLLPEEDETDDDVLHIWALNTSITYAAVGVHPTRGIKLLYQTMLRPEADGLVDKLAANVQDIRLPRAVLADVRRLLTASTNLLPESERTMQAWTIGLLPRWPGS